MKKVIFDEQHIRESLVEELLLASAIAEIRFTFSNYFFLFKKESLGWNAYKKNKPMLPLELHFDPM